jgi:hypothetical protein
MLVEISSYWDVVDVHEDRVGPIVLNKTIEYSSCNASGRECFQMPPDGRAFDINSMASSRRACRNLPELFRFRALGSARASRASHLRAKPLSPQCVISSRRERRL